jgi:hypothetical protein
MVTRHPLPSSGTVTEGACGTGTYSSSGGTMTRSPVGPLPLAGPRLGGTPTGLEHPIPLAGVGEGLAGLGPPLPPVRPQ